MRGALKAPHTLRGSAIDNHKDQFSPVVKFFRRKRSSEKRKELSPMKTGKEGRREVDGKRVEKGK